MVANVAFDTAIGAIPVAGDIWDFFFRSNDRNMPIARWAFSATRRSMSATACRRRSA